MSEQPSKRRDAWDFVDLLVKIASGLVLLWFTVVVKQGAEDIALAMRKGELVQRLIGDLTASPDARVRQDLAIIALDGSVGADDSEMVAAIVEKLFELRPATTEAELTNDTAFTVLKRRSPKRASALQERAVKAVSNKDRQTLVSAASAVPTDVSEPGPQPAAEAKAVATVFSNVLYIQFQGQLKRELINELRGAYQQEGIGTPEAERLAGQYKSSVRFFHDEDRAKAEAVANRATRFFMEKKCALVVDVEDLTAKRSQVPMGQLELWINHNCG